MRAHDAPATVLLSLALVVGVTLVAFAPTLGNGFLQVGFDDAIVTDTPAIRSLGRSDVESLFTQFNHAHYVPLTLLSLAVDHALWGLDPFGFHLTNVLLQAVVAALVWLFLRPLLPSPWATTLAALVFAVHPLQLEAVTLAIQRKTMLSGVGFFASLLCYRRWRDGRGGIWYAGALTAFAAAALAKPIVVTLPLVLWLYDYVFVDGRLRWLDKIPFLLVAAATTAAAAAAHAAVGAMIPPTDLGGMERAAVMARVFFEYVAAVLLPIDLAPSYYYRRALVFEPLNLLALAALAALVAWVYARRRRDPWTFFCLAWFALTLLPESNLFPLVQLRADRFLYLPLVGAAVWIAVALELCGERFRLGRGAMRLAAALLVCALAVQTRASAAVWQSDVTAWSRVVQRQPWAASGWLLLGHAYVDRGEPARAEAAYVESLRRDPDRFDAHLALARLLVRRGAVDEAAAHLSRSLALRPGDEEALALRREVEEATPLP